VAGVWVGFDQPRTILPNGYAGDIAVPMWAEFMKVATRGDSPDWFTPPAGVTTATVCRLSGKLATEGCENVDVVDPDGKIERRSMVYTEYFARGTQPTTFCDLHPTRGLLGKLAGLFDQSDHPSPPHIADTGLRPGTAGTTGATVEPASAPGTEAAIAPANPEEPKKKRGFWARFFGIGKDDKDKDADPQSAETAPQPKKRPGQ